VDARRSASTLIVGAHGRGRGCESLDSAIERGHRYAEAGADVLFIEGAALSVTIWRRSSVRSVRKRRCSPTWWKADARPFSPRMSLPQWWFRIVIFPVGIVRGIGQGGPRLTTRALGPTDQMFRSRIGCLI